MLKLWRCSIFSLSGGDGGIGEDVLALAPTLAVRSMIEVEPNYPQISARLLLYRLRHEERTHVGEHAIAATQADMAIRCPEYFAAHLASNLRTGLLDPELARFDRSRTCKSTFDL